ncbi:TetR/AcrR family transcriptional regulator [Parendozoicomonas sp. Alg238-R29]|uniref:TetR/AcrR family transcriptional regulator n=1 Tax=Parendozoicomonas sp. Alg238-R29 TaxID=2993446 RepID=UPI00248D74F4|nr:TetR/AcrR family transcriptional regulator [Parendozoicomonas sp. Alg238-R29]
MSKRDQILEASLKLFMENGFEKTPTSAISKAAGVATGTLFHHFKTKEDLISALYFEIKMEMRNLLMGNLKEGSSLKEQILSMFAVMIDWALESQDKFLFLAQFGESAFITSSTRERIDEAFGGGLNILGEGVSSGVFHQLPVELLSRQLAAQLFTSAGYVLDNPDCWQDQNFRTALLQYFWNSIAKK